MILIIVTALLPLIGHANDNPKINIPTGEFKVTFLNGVVETCTLAEDATVKVTQKNRTSTGSTEIKEDKFLIRYEDDRLEQWQDVGGAFMVHHWYPISNYPDKQPQIGLAEKTLEGNLEVHEWGTFTVLQGSDGKTIRWYQAPDKLVDLPPFVRQQFTPFGKSRSANLYAGLDSVRMETPVLYFYPEKAMDIRVSASYPTGRITEVFPPVSFQINSNGPSLWRGTLLPPNAPEKSRVPAATGPKGRHYAAARNVPDAWLFSQIAPGSKVPPTSKKTGKPVDEPIDHFIFYRGAGNADSFPIRAVEQKEAGTYQLSNFYHQTIPKLFALRVKDGKSSWTTIEQLARVGYNKEKKIQTNKQAFNFPKATGDVKEVAAGLRDTMVEALHAEGLTLAEAKAMVATWDDLWFTDPGTRVLAILPQSYADEMVPLQITPKPTKLERVFVARLELINREQEHVLTRVLAPYTSTEEKTAGDQLASLQLGRYSAGGMARAKTLISAEIEARFTRLEKNRKAQDALKNASAKVTN